MMAEQLPIFGFHDMRPRIRASKLVSPERVREVQAAMKSGSVEDQIKAMRALREGLESFDRRLKNK